MHKTEQGGIQSYQKFRKVTKVQPPLKACQYLMTQKKRHYIH